MSEEKNFKYVTENPVFPSSEEPEPEEVEITRIRNLLPIEITYKADGVEKKIVAGVDYNTNEISIPSLPEETVGKISEKFFEFVYRSTALPSDLFAEDRPTVTPVPKEEDIQW